jgi:hypothetical protein
VSSGGFSASGPGRGAREGGNRLPQLRGELVAAAVRRAAAVDGASAGRDATARAATVRARRTIRHARRVPLFAAGFAALLLSAAVALAASGLIRTGAPVKPLPGEHFTPTTGYGVPIPTTVRLLPITVPDPAGGPPWGLRYLQTTRGLACVEVGRVVDGHLGVLGRDGSFADDGRFHELPADVFEPLSCAPLDGRGQAFVSLTFHGRPASGTYRLGCLPPGIGPEPHTSTCPRADERLVSYGLLGPDARSLSYRVGDTTRTIPVTGPLGAYLLVEPLTAPRGQTLGWVAPLTSPGASPFTQVTYTNGAVCRIPPAQRVGGARPCPLVGWVPAPGRPLGAAGVAAPVAVRVGPLSRIADPLYRQHAQLARRLYLSFITRVAVSTADSRYVVELHPPTQGACASHNHGIRLSPIERNVAAGETVHVWLSLEPACPGRWSGSVIYLAPSVRGGPEPLSMVRSRLRLLDDELDGRLRPHPPVVGHFAFAVR